MASQRPVGSNTRGTTNPNRAEPTGGSRVPRPGLTFCLGGFEIPLARGARPAVVRAFNVLRQYDEADVLGARRQIQDRLAPGGLLVDGTCDEVGRLASWWPSTPAAHAR